MRSLKTIGSGRFPRVLYSDQRTVPSPSPVNVAHPAGSRIHPSRFPLHLTLPCLGPYPVLSIYKYVFSMESHGEFALSTSGFLDWIVFAVGVCFG